MYVGKTITNHPMFDGLYHLFMVNLGIVYYCFNHIICHFDKGQGDDSPNPILIPYCLLYPRIILNPHTAIPIIPKLPYYNIYIYTYIYIHICIPIIVYIYHVGPCLQNRQVGGHRAAARRLGRSRPGLSLKTRSAKMDPVALQQTDAWGRDRWGPE